jgi:hypothetical protein
MDRTWPQIDTIIARFLSRGLQTALLREPYLDELPLYNRHNGRSESMRGFEKRQFGRRSTQIRGKIIVPGKHPIVCLVRNISKDGALLEFDRRRTAPYHFQLIIEADGFEAECEFKHKTERGVGVFFCEARIARNGRDSRLAGDSIIGPQWERKTPQTIV